MSRQDRFLIPDDVQRNIRARLRQKGWTVKEINARWSKFRNWFKSHMKSNRSEQQVYAELGAILEDAGLQKKVKAKGMRRQSLALSHIEPYSKGGSGLNFLESWYVNWKRGDKNLVPEKSAQIAGLPRNWEELFYFWDLQDSGKSTSSLGPLEDINVDDVIALHRGDSVNKVFNRRERLNEILINADESEGLTITRDQEEYATLLNQSQGLNPYDTRESSLRADAGFDIGPDGGYVRKDEFDLEATNFARTEERRTNPLSIRHQTYDYETDEGLEDISQVKSDYDRYYVDKERQMELELHPDEELLANIKKGAWNLARNHPKTAIPMGVADIFIDQDKRGDLHLTKPKWREAIHPLVRVGLDAVKPQTTITPIPVTQPEDANLPGIIQERNRILMQDYRKQVSPSGKLLFDGKQYIEDAFPDEED